MIQVVAIGIFVVVLAVAFVLLLSMSIGAFSAMFSGMRADFVRRRPVAGASDASVVPEGTESPTELLGDLADTMRTAQSRRWNACRAIRERLDESRTAADDESPAGTSGYVVLAFDLWTGNAFDERTVGSDDTLAVGAGRRYRLGGGERRDFDRFAKDRVGQIAWTTALVADRVSRHPAWKLDFFGRHSVRVDLAGEVTAITLAAAALRDQLAILGDTPEGHLGADAEVIATFVAKSRLLSGRLDGLVARLEAFADYEQIVARIQQRQEKQAWLERVREIDDYEHVVGAEWDRAEGERVRNLADESDVLASIYLDEIAPLAKSLKQD